MSVTSVFPFRYDEHDFSNGLRLVTVPTPYPGLISFYIVVAVGSRNEVEAGKSGFAHFFEHMMFRGTERFPPARYEAAMQAAGASSNAYTSDDQTVYHATFTRDDFEEMIDMEADRFRNLSYPVEAFRTEALAVLGEYKKDSAEPMNKIQEALREAAFQRHTYRHTTMGFLADIEDMPNQYDYSRLFFRRFYRPEYTTLVVAGAVSVEETVQLVERYWGDWEPGDYKVEIPQESPPQGPKKIVLPWKTSTLPYLVMGYRADAYSDVEPDAPALDLIARLAFSETSPLYQELVLEKQVVDSLWGSNPDHVDPYLFLIAARVKERESFDAVRERVLEELGIFATSPVDAKRLEEVKSNLRYGFALSMDNTEQVASTLAHYISLRRRPETINRLFGMYEQITPEVLMQTAARYFTPERLTEVHLFAEAAE